MAWTRKDDTRWWQGDEVLRTVNQKGGNGQPWKVRQEVVVADADYSVTAGAGVLTSTQAGGSPY